ncbi:MAG: LacI family transcriptional regulator, partial [Gammaproteobacteria bacterium]
MARPTVKDIAKHAEVSLATVDRVLNGRAGVRKSTIARVYKTIEEIGYVRDIDAANLARRREYKML